METEMSRTRLLKTQTALGWKNNQEKIWKTGKKFGRPRGRLKVKPHCVLLCIILM